VAADEGADAPGPDASHDAEADSAPEAGYDASADAQNDSGADAGHDAGGGASVPCTSAGQTNCVKCDQNTSGVCTGTEALIVQWDIDKGLVTGDVPKACEMSNSGVQCTMGSCYECLVQQACIDNSVGTANSGNECEDLTGMVSGGANAGESEAQACIDSLACILGNPASTTTPSSCANLPAPGDGVFNCFCGPAETDTNDCKMADTIAANNTSGGIGVASPDGICAQTFLDGLGDTTMTSNGTVITALSNAGDNGPAQAVGILQCAGSDEMGPPCAQCFQ
jgi:hypothetical protein